MQQITLCVESETAAALAEYMRANVGRFGSPEGAADHLLRCALTGVSDGASGIEGAMRAAIAPLLATHVERIAALLTRSGKDAHRAAALGELLAAHLLPDTEDAARVAEEARLRAVARYTRRDFTSEEHPPQ